MQNLSDEDLDKLFKRAAEQQQTQFDPADWDNMANRLDTNKRPWLNYYTGAGSLVLLGVVIWLGWLSYSSSKIPVAENVAATVMKEAKTNAAQLVDDVKVSSSVANKSLSSTEKVEKLMINKSALVQNNDMDHPVKKVTHKDNQVNRVGEKFKPLEENVSSIVDVQSAEPSLLSSSGYSSQSNDDKLIAQSTEHHAPVLIKDQNNSSSANLDLSEAQHSAGSIVIEEKNHVVSNNDPTQIKTQTNPELDPMSTHEANGHSSFQNDQTSPLVIVDSAEVMKNNEKELHQELETDKSDSVSEKPSFTRFAIKATVAPDFSSEQFKSVDKMGFNYGLIAEYFLTKNISIATGALWSRKYYSAEDVDYNGYHADRAYGDCRMWDIPLNVNYYFTPLKQYSFFASAGFSSYLMNEENYEYEVDTNYGKKTYTSQVIKENNEWFKTLNVSVGLQKQINSRFAIQIEPFVKVPLAGVGEGNISLASFGGFFSVKYNLLTLKK